MDISKIKQLVKQNGDKFIFVENGEPEVVMMSWQEYQKFTKSDSNPSLLYKSEGRMHPNYLNYSNDELELLESPLGARETEFVRPVLAESIGLPVRLEDIRLEDLPI